MNVSDRKADLRIQARQHRKTLHGERATEAAAGIVEHGRAGIAELWGNTAPGIVAGYLAVGSELDAGPLMAALEAQGWSLALPVVVAPGKPLVFRRWARGDALAAGSFGISQPTQEQPQVRPDVVLAPLLAFDEGGYRLGQGGGFYDRTLEHWRGQGHQVPVLGLAFAAQRVDVVPRDDYDQRLSGIITEDGWRKFGDDPK